MNNREKKFYKERAEELSKVSFPNELLPDGFHELIRRAMRYNSIGRFRCHPSTWRNLILHERPFLMPEIELAIDILKYATPLELNQTLKENISMLENVVAPLVDRWNRIEKEICEPLIKKYQARKQIHLPNATIGIS